jgi:hypothetical protein
MQSISEISLTGHTTQYDSCRPRLKPHSRGFFQIRKIMNRLMCLLHCYPNNKSIFFAFPPFLLIIFVPYLNAMSITNGEWLSDF